MKSYHCNCKHPRSFLTIGLLKYWRQFYLIEIHVTISVTFVLLIAVIRNSWKSRFKWCSGQPSCVALPPSVLKVLPLGRGIAQNCTQRSAGLGQCCYHCFIVMSSLFLLPSPLHEWYPNLLRTDIFFFKYEGDSKSNHYNNRKKKRKKCTDVLNLYGYNHNIEKETK